MSKAGYSVEVEMVNQQSNIKRKFLSHPYPENLILTLMLGKLASFEVTNDIKAGLDYALGELTDIERETLKFRFQDNLTYKQIGEIRGRSKNVACGSENNAMRKLRHSSRLGYILYGKEGFEAMGCVFHLPWEAPPPKKEGPEPRVLLIPLEDLDLSIHSFNMLKRAGCEIVLDIVNMTQQQIMDIKNFPTKNCTEVAKKLKDLGYNQTVWNEFSDDKNI